MELGLSCHQVANTIFSRLPLESRERQDTNLFQSDISISSHRIRKHPRNQHGVYFQRLISASVSDGNYAWHGVNQLGHIIKHLETVATAAEQPCRLLSLIRARIITEPTPTGIPLPTTGGLRADR